MFDCPDQRSSSSGNRYKNICIYYLLKIEVDEEPSKTKILKGIKHAVKEVNLVKAGNQYNTR